MNRKQELVRELHKAFGLPANDQPTLQVATMDALRAHLIQEELDELREAQRDSDITGIADALGDLLYVVYGAGVTYGIDLEPVFEEIHRSNMTKLDPETGKPIIREDGKFLKGAAYRPPDVRGILEKQRRHPNDPLFWRPTWS